jgi:phenylalanyl-tRNA synthetase beta chain
MKILYNWLKDFVDPPWPAASPEEARARLSSVGIVVDVVEDSAAGPLFDVDLTTNRPDCMGHYGVAREVAAIYRTRLKPIQPKLREAAEKAKSATRVEIECPDLCARFTARVLRGVKVGPSPEWLRQRLEALGQQSINNVVDATNYVMLELGHPLHAFDFDTLAEKRIVVRRPRPGEKIRTLDDVERQLSPEMCMVCDAARPVGIGGVMGGAATEISLFSTNVLLECAWFDPISIRHTAKALGLRTEASTRFERGADPEMAELASRRCAELIQQIAGGEVLAGVVDVYPGKPASQKIELTRRELLRVMGADVPDAEIEAILAALGLAPLAAAPRATPDALVAAWECTRPSWRHDVTREIDLIEEVARHYGYDKFPARLPVAKQAAARLPHAEAEDRFCERLVALGYDEIIAIPLVDPEEDALFRPADVTPAKLGNPLAEDASLMRSSGLANMLRALEWNINRGERNVRLFEIGRRYEFRGSEPVETRILTLGATGLAREKGIYEEAREYSFADLKGELDSLSEIVGGLRWSRDFGASAPDWLHPARAARISLASGCSFVGRAFNPADPGGSKEGVLTPEALGFAGQLARRIADRFKLRQDVFVAELLLDPLCTAYDAARAAVSYTPLPRFHAVERDFSLLLAEGTTFAQVAEVIRSLGIAEVARVNALDLYRGKNVPAGKYSLLVRVTFQSQDATLTESEISGFTSRIVAALTEKLAATLRT